MIHSFSEKQHNELLQKKYYHENELSEANQKASLTEEEIFMYKVNNSKLSEQNTKLMIALVNSKGSQDTLEKQLSEAVALGSYELTNDGSASKASKADAKEPSSSPAATGLTPKLLSKKELKKLRQKTRKKLLSIQAKEAEDITEGDDNLNKSDPNDNYENDPTNNNLPNSDKSKPPDIAESPQNEKVMNILLILTHTTTMVHLSLLQTSSTSPQPSHSPTSPLTPLLSPANMTPLPLA